MDEVLSVICSMSTNIHMTALNVISEEFELQSRFHQSWILSPIVFFLERGHGDLQSTMSSFIKPLNEDKHKSHHQSSHSDSSIKV